MCTGGRGTVHISDVMLAKLRRHPARAWYRPMSTEVVDVFWYSARGGPHPTGGWVLREAWRSGERRYRDTGGALHRLDGPAVESSFGDEWWLYGIQFEPGEHAEIVARLRAMDEATDA